MVTKRVKIFSDPKGEEKGPDKKSSHKGIKIAGGVAAGTVATGAIGYGGLHVARRINDKRIEERINESYKEPLKSAASDYSKAAERARKSEANLERLTEAKKGNVRFFDKIKKKLSPERWEKNLDEKIAKGKEELEQLVKREDSAERRLDLLRQNRSKSIIRAKENSIPNRAINAIDNTAKRTWRRAAIGARKLKRLIKR